MKVQIQALHFNDLTARQLFQILKLRQDVFFVEEEIIYPDLDDTDDDCIHVFATTEKDGKTITVSYARVYFDPLEQHVKVGRVVTAAAYRGQGIGGDSDTICAMAGSIAQAMYGIPKPLAGYCYECLTPELRSILDEFEDMTDHHTDDPFNLERFLTMQTPVYKTVLEEMRNGCKRGHYMWYIFPQLRGLGHSANSYIYGLADIEEAKVYLHHSVLGSRLRETIKVLLDRDMDDISSVLDRGRTDNINTLKFRSCLTLFDEASSNDIFNEAIKKFYSGKRDDLTLQRLSRMELTDN